MRIKKFGILFYLLLILAISDVSGQGDPNLPQIIPPSPDAASLGKYGEIPVGKYTGTANITVPIYVIEFDGLSIPISVNYHTGGIKVEELASWVGLGWSLNAGGIITKSVVGLPDNMAGIGYLNNAYTDVESILSLPAGEQNAIHQQVEKGLLDVEPDNYYFNFLGYSGKLFIDKATNTVHTIPKTNLKFQYPNWQIVDAKGFRYIFNDGETTSVETNFPGNHGSYSTSSTWVLTKIIAPSGREISFVYQDYSNLYYQRGGQSKHYLVAQNAGFGSPCATFDGSIKTNYTLHDVQGKRIQQIIWDGGKVVFNKTANNREDIVGDYCLDNIEIYNSGLELIQKHKLFYSFRSSTTGMSSFGTSFTSLIGGKRVFLDSVQQVSTTESIPAYKFTYDASNLPYYLSYAQDHWGYHNGATNTNLLPIVQGGFGFANRNVNFSSTKAGSLSKIVYPTGGETEFQYESNEALLEVCNYMTYLNPNNTNNQAPSFSVSVNQGAQVATLNVPAALCPGQDTVKQFTYVVNFPTAINCQSATRSCIGALEVILYSTTTNQSFNLLANPITNGQTTGTLMLKAGTSYILEMSGPGSAVNGVSATVTGKQNPATFLINGTNYVNAKVGGLRVAKVTSRSLVDLPTSTKYFYYDRDDVLSTSVTNQRSSGRAGGIGSIVPIYTLYNIKNCGSDESGNAYQQLLALHAASLSPLSSESGSPLGYKMVEELKEGSSDKIRSISTFTSFDEHPDVVSTTYPTVVTYSYDDWRGMPLKEYQFLYNQSNQSYSVLASVNNKYITDPLLPPVGINGLKRSCFTTFTTGGISVPICSDNIFKAYRRRVIWRYLSEKTEQIYDKSNLASFNEKKTTYTYADPRHLEVTKTEETNSKGEVIITENKYPHDFATLSPYSTMIERNMIGTAVESKVSNITKNIEISKVKTNYSMGPTGLILPQSITKALLGSTLEPEVTFGQYDEKGNVLEFIGKDGIVNSFLWGYNKRYPVAKIIGRTYADIVAQSGIDMSIVNNPASDEALRVELNKLRLLPGSLVSTYTYRPLVGVTSETDANNITVYYEYDVFNRLRLVRDNDGNILKKADYQYKQ